jgi:hypothetical protein
MAPEKKVIWFAFVLTAIVLIPHADAVLEMLPQSSYYSGGRTFAFLAENGDRVSGRIDFAVYDTEESPDEVLAFEEDGYDFGGDQFVYAYQIFNNVDDLGSNPFAYFGLLNIAQVPIHEVSTVNNTSYSTDSPDNPSEEGIYPSASPTQGAWEFEDSEGSALLLEGEHSLFLLMSSPNDWKRGSFEIKTQLDWVAMPQEDTQPNPEPASIMLFAAVGVMTLIRKNKSV